MTLDGTENYIMWEDSNVSSSEFKPGFQEDSQADNGMEADE